MTSILIESDISDNRRRRFVRNACNSLDSERIGILNGLAQVSKFHVAYQLLCGKAVLEPGNAVRAQLMAFAMICAIPALSILSWIGPRGAAGQLIKPLMLERGE
jgi:hypothetical protein